MNIRRKIKVLLQFCLLAFCVPQLFLITSCSSTTASSSSSREENKESTEYDEIVNFVNKSNLYSSWDNDSNETYLEGYIKKISIFNFEKVKNKYQNKVALKWYLNNTELSNYNDVSEISCSSNGIYLAKIFYTPENKEIFRFNSFEFKIVNSLESVSLKLSNKNLTNDIRNITASLNIISQVPNNQYTIKWFKNDVELNQSSSLLISEPGNYTWKIFNNSNNRIINSDSFTINKIIDATELTPSNINWDNITLNFLTQGNINIFDYNNQNIKLLIIGLPTSFFSNRYDLKIMKDDLDITSSLSIIKDKNNNSASFNLNYKNGSGTYSYKIIDNIGTNNYIPQNQTINLSLGNVVNLDNLSIDLENNGIITSNNGIISTLNINNSEITSQDEFLNYYNIQWINKDNGQIQFENQFDARFTESGNYTCKIILKSNNNINKSIDFGIIVADSIIDFEINSPKTIIGNSINDTYNTFTLDIKNFELLRQNNYQIYLNETLIDNSILEINIDNLNNQDNILKLSLNNVITQTYNIDTFVNMYKDTLYLTDDNMTLYNINPLYVESNGSVADSSSKFKTLTTSSIKSFLFSKYTKLYIKSNMLTSFKSNATISTLDKYNSMGLPINLDPYEWTGVFQNWEGLTEVNIDAPNFDFLDKSSFYSCPNLRKVVIKSDQLFKIENYAFRDCSNLSQAIMPEKVEYISAQAFFNTRSLKNFSFSPNLKSLSLQSFKNTGLVSVDISNCKKISLGNGAFSKNIYLKEFKYYGVNVDDIGDNTITSKIDEPGLSIINESAFQDCNSLSKFYPVNKISNVNDGEIYLSDYVILGKDNFKGCSKVKKVIHYPSKTPNVPPGMFSDTSLEEFTFTPNIKTIAVDSFGGILSNKFTNMVVPEGVKYIEHNAFAGSSIETISLPSTLEKLGINILSDCLIKKVNINFDHISLTDENQMISNDPGNELIKKSIFQNIYINDDSKDPLVVEFGRNVIQWNDSSPVNSNREYLTLEDLLWFIKENDTTNVVQYKCYSETLKQQLMSIGILEKNIIVTS